MRCRMESPSDEAMRCRFAVNQSLAIRSNHQALHFLGVIYLMQAAESNPPFAGQEKAQEGIALLNEQILTRGVDDAYPHSAYLTHVARWYSHAGALIPQRQWEELRRVAQTALNRFPKDDSVSNAVANRQRIASSEGLSIRHRITPLNVGRSRHLRRRLVAVPACIAGRERRGRVAPEAGGRAAQRVFSRQFVRFPA